MESQKINQNNNYDSDSSYDSSSDDSSSDEEYEADRQLYFSTNSDTACWDSLKCFVANLDKYNREKLTRMKESIKTMKQQLKHMKDNNIIIMKSYNKIFK